ncbi:MAG: hypothetical protein DRI79_09280 [Chloroflexi bacterium]|nr:MAG: hypothetical protein DRI79_09280 [Chloroflexota bacterium]
MPGNLPKYLLRLLLALLKHRAETCGPGPGQLPLDQCTPEESLAFLRRTIPTSASCGGIC